MFEFSDSDVVYREIDYHTAAVDPRAFVAQPELISSLLSSLVTLVTLTRGIRSGKQQIVAPSSESIQNVKMEVSLPDFNGLCVQSDRRSYISVSSVRPGYGDALSIARKALVTAIGDRKTFK